MVKKGISEYTIDPEFDEVDDWNKPKYQIYIDIANSFRDLVDSFTVLELPSEVYKYEELSRCYEKKIYSLLND